MSILEPRSREVDTGFDDPRELLLSCHEKVHRFTRLALRVADHVREHGADEQAREAAARILRYFRIAAPLHHEDEEIDVFPALLALPDDVLEPEKAQTMREHIDRLLEEHDILDDDWAIISAWLDSIDKNQVMATPPQLAQWVQRYDAHIDREQSEVFPYVALLEESQRQHICLQMAQRRGLTIS